MRSINSVWSAQQINMGGTLIEQSLPHQNASEINPFLLVHHWKEEFPGGQDQKTVGVGPHPHRGFAPVTLIFKGGIHHRDSLGNNSVINAGGTQWTFAGKGIVHSERPEKSIAEEGGAMELIQFWVNVPTKFKMEPAHYYPLTVEETPSFWSKDNQVEVSVVAGEINQLKGPIASFTPMLILRVEFKDKGEVALDIPKEFNTLSYVLDGEVEANSVKAKAKDLVHFKNDDTRIVLESKGQASAIILAGQAIDEPINTYGPFVMNTAKEIMEALRDAQMGKMGILIEEFD